MGDSTILRLRFAEGQSPFLEDVSRLLYDLTLANDLAVILSYRDYSDYRFTRFFWFRGQRRVFRHHRLRAVTISKRSPLVLEVAAVVGAVWALIQIVEKVQNWKLNKQKLKLEFEKLQGESALKQLEMLEKAGSLEEQVRRRHADYELDHLLLSLEKLPFHLVDVEIRIAPKGNEDAGNDV